LLKVAFAFGNFILPKQMIQTFKISKPAPLNDQAPPEAAELAFGKVIVRNPQTKAFFITKKYSKLNIETDDKNHPVFYDADLLSILRGTRDSNKLQAFKQTDEFFGLLRHFTYEQKKAEVLDNYKLIFRFSISKLSEYLCKETFLIIVMQYLKETQLQRIHQRAVLLKNKSAYYRVVENLLNFSNKEGTIKNIISSWPSNVRVSSDVGEAAPKLPLIEVKAEDGQIWL